MSDSNAAQTVWDIANLATRARRQAIQSAFVGRHGWRVSSGPFAGMTLPEQACWGDGDTLPKLLGCYELELQQAIAAAVAKQPELVVNIGAAEGYYAIGLARALPHARVHAFEATEKGIEICRDAARLNDVADRVLVSGACDTGQLQTLLAGARNPFLLCDCEGCERVLIDPAVVPALASATMIVECHDFIDATITRALVERLNATHDLQAIREGGRDPNTSEFLRLLSSLDRWIAVCEYRPCMMHWLIATPKPPAVLINRAAERPAGGELAMTERGLPRCGQSGHQCLAGLTHGRASLAHRCHHVRRCCFRRSRVEWRGGCIFDLQLNLLRGRRADHLGHDDKAKSIPAVTPPPVKKLPSRTTRPSVGSAPNAVSKSRDAQCEVACLPRSNPAAASTREPVQTEVT